ncbi:MAG: hypothetical protein AAF429_06060 [Pseudomonadota bacterium]
MAFDFQDAMVDSSEITFSEGEAVQPNISFVSSVLLVLCITIAGSAATAQNQHPAMNVFFGFEFVLHPLAIKWACGGQRDVDLYQVDRLVVAFPEDAEQTEMTPFVATLNEMATGLQSLPTIFGGDLSEQQAKQLCAAALQLNIDWVTPEQFGMGDESGMPDKQEAAWANFFRVVAGF